MGMYDSLMNPGGAGQNALLAFQQARGLRQRDEQQKAMTAYATNPNDQSLNALAPYDPQFVIQQRQQMAKQQQEQQAAQLRMAAAQGDAGALQQLVGIDFDSWKALDGSLKQKVKAQNDYIGQAALRISQLDPQQQPAAWDQAIAQGVQMGFPELQNYAGKYSPQAVQGAIDNAGLVEKFISLAEPRYMAVPNDATLVNTRNPSAVASFGASAAPATTAIPAAAADHLRQHPELKDAFDQKYGAGASDRILGGSGGNAGGNFPGR